MLSEEVKNIKKNQGNRQFPMNIFVQLSQKKKDVNLKTDQKQISNLKDTYFHLIIFTLFQNKIGNL